MSLIQTIRGKSNFSNKNAEDAAKSFKAAMKGFGTDEKRIMPLSKELISHTNEQRQLIEERYQVMYGKSLESDLKSELNGDFENIVVALLKTRFEFEAECLRDAISGVGTKESVVIELLCTKDANEIEKLKKAYSDKYVSDLEKDIKNEEDGPLGRIFRSLASGDRPSGAAVDFGLAQEEAKQLYEAGEKKQLGTDEDEFVRILCSRSYAQLRATFDEYAKIAGKSIKDSIKQETSGDLEDALLALVQSIQNPQLFFAERLKESMKSVGTKDKDIIRIIVSRSEIDLVNIRREYKNLYGVELADDLKRELTGDFEDIVLELVGKD